MYKATSSLLRATRSKLSSSSSRTFAYPHTRISPSLTAASSSWTFSSAAAAAASSFPRWSHRLDWSSPLSIRAQIRAVAPLFERFHRNFASMASENPFKGNLTSLPKPSGGESGKFYSLPSLNDPRVDRLPYSIRILLESAIRNCDNFQVTKEDVEKIIDWENSSSKQVEIPFKPACVLLQEFTGVPAVVDLACMRDSMNKLGSDSKKINPLNYNALGLDILSLARAGNGLGSSRVWAANGPVLLGVRGAYADTLGLTGHKRVMSTVAGTTNETKSPDLSPVYGHSPSTPFTLMSVTTDS